MRSALLLLALAVATPLGAHPLAPSVLELREREAGRLDVEWKVPAARAPGASAVPLLPPRCHDVSPREVLLDPVAARTRWVVDCEQELGAGDTIGVRNVEAAGAVVRLIRRDGPVSQRLVLPADPSFVVPADAGPWDATAGYLRLGVEHILSGPDHLLFVFGLVLLAGAFRRVVGTVTAFTFGHSLTLAAAVLGLVRLPQAPIEVAIAASVFALAVELARAPRESSAMRRHPWAMAALFGLLHGLGFASVLTDAGLARADVPLALLGFNVGIEAGQIFFVAIVLAARGLVSRLPLALPAWTRLLPVYAMGTLAAFWLLERAAALF